MNEKPLTVHEVVNLTGITARTLHYYDEIGLLKPSIVTEAKYRLYTDTDLCRLQENLLNSPHYNRTEALEKHLCILEAQRERIDGLISLVKAEISGGKTISFSEFSNSKVMELQSQFQKEVLEKWGDTESFKEYEAIFSSKAQEVQNEQMTAFFSMAQNIFEKLAIYENKSPDCPEVQNVVREWQLYITEHFYQCDKQILFSLGKMYVSDLRFSDFINRFGNGNLAAFFSKAIEIFCSRQREERNDR